jgi:hypothetical protein
VSYLIAGHRDFYPFAFLSGCPGVGLAIANNAPPRVWGVLRRLNCLRFLPQVSRLRSTRLMRSATVRTAHACSKGFTPMGRRLAYELMRCVQSVMRCAWNVGELRHSLRSWFRRLSTGLAGASAPLGYAIRWRVIKRPCLIPLFGYRNFKRPFSLTRKVALG